MYSFEDGFEHFCGRVKLHWMWWPRLAAWALAWVGSSFLAGSVLATTTLRNCCAAMLRLGCCLAF